MYQVPKDTRTSPVRPPRRITGPVPSRIREWPGGRQNAEGMRTYGLHAEEAWAYGKVWIPVDQGLHGITPTHTPTRRSSLVQEQQGFHLYSERVDFGLRIWQFPSFWLSNVCLMIRLINVGAYLMCGFFIEETSVGGICNLNVIVCFFCIGGLDVFSQVFWTNQCWLLDNERWYVLSIAPLFRVSIRPPTFFFSASIRTRTGLVALLYHSIEGARWMYSRCLYFSLVFRRLLLAGHA